MKVLLLFNGPPRSGKDTAADYAWRKLGANNTMKFKLSRPLKEGLAAFFNLDTQALRWLEDNKETPTPVLFGKSWREVQISLSEDWAKKQFGDEAFGELAARWLYAGNLRPISISSDTGFQPETEKLIEKFHPERTIVVRIHRPGHTFDGDSRGYISPPSATDILDIQNTGTLNAFYDTLDGVFFACGLTQES